MATSKTYKDLCEFVRKEAKVTQRPFGTGSSFTTVDDEALERIKDYVRQAWMTIQMERDWPFMVKTAVVIVKPRIYLEQLSTSTVAIVAGDTLTGQDTSATLSVTGVELISGAWASGTAKAYIEYEDLSGHFKFNEIVTRAGVDNSRVKGNGRYDLTVTVTDLLEPDKSSFFLSTTGGSTTQSNDDSFARWKLMYVDWDKFIQVAEGGYEGFGMPKYITQTPDGTWDFFPRPNQEYVLSFQYKKEPQEFSAETDTPTGLPAEFHDGIGYRALMFYSNWDNKQTRWSTGKTRWMEFKSRMERILLRPPSYPVSAYDKP